MHVREFKAWLEGFEESLGNKAPNKEQWKKIKAKLEQVTDSGWTYTYPLYPWTYTISGSGTSYGAISAANTTLTDSATTTWYSMGQLEARQ